MIYSIQTASDQEHFFVCLELRRKARLFDRLIAWVGIEDGSPDPVVEHLRGWKGSPEELQLVAEMQSKMRQEVVEWRSALVERLDESVAKEAHAEYRRALDLYDQFQFTAAERHLHRGDELRCLAP